MRPLLALLIAPVLLFAAPLPKGMKAKKSDAALLEGRWEGVTIDRGKGHETDASYWLEVKDGKLSSGLIGKQDGFKQVPFALDPTQLPKHIDITCSGVVLPWIYEIDGDTLTWCHPSGGTDRPTGMKSDKPYCCTVWKRVKEEK